MTTQAVHSALQSDTPFEAPALCTNMDWVQPWVIKVSAGHAGIIMQLLEDIEEILHPAPALQFLRVVEEQQEDELFIRELRIFIEPGELPEAQTDAINYACNKARKRSNCTCFICGQKVTFKHMEDEVYSGLLSKLFEQLDIREFSTSRLYWCPHCIDIGFGSGGGNHANNDDNHDDIPSTKTTEKQAQKKQRPNKHDEISDHKV